MIKSGGDRLTDLEGQITEIIESIEAGGDLIVSIISIVDIPWDLPEGLTE